MPSSLDGVFVPCGFSAGYGDAQAAALLAFDGGKYTHALHELEDCRFPIFSAASKNGRFIAVLQLVLSEGGYPPGQSFESTKFRVSVFDTNAWKLASSFEGAGDVPNALVVSDAGAVALAINAVGVRVVDGLTGEDLATLSFGSNPPATYMGPRMLPILEFSPAQDYLFVGRASCGVAAFKTDGWARDEAMLLDPTFHDPLGPEDDTYLSSPVMWLKFNPAGTAVYFCDMQFNVRGRSWPALEEVTVPLEVTDAAEITDVAFSPDGLQLFYTVKAGMDGAGEVYRIGITSAESVAEKVVTTTAGDFAGGARLGLSLSPDGQKLLIAGTGGDSAKDMNVGGASYSVRASICDVASGAVEKTFTWTVRGHLTDSFCRFALWLPLAKLSLVTGVIKDADGVGVVRDVLVQARQSDSLILPAWTKSDESGQFAVPIGLPAGTLLSRVAFDNTGTFNDLIDKVQV